MMSGNVTCLFEGSPSCSRGSLLEEGSTSLKTLTLLLSQWNDHLNCSNQWWLLYLDLHIPPWMGFFCFPTWSMILNYIIPLGVNCFLTISKVVISEIYCDPESSSLMSCSVWRIFSVTGDVWRICSVTGVVCHGMACNCVLGVLNRIFLSCIYGNCTCPIVVIWRGLCTSNDSWSCNVCCV